MPSDPARKDRLINIILTVLLLAATVEIVLLVRQNRALRADLEDHSRLHAQAPTVEGGPEVGKAAPSMDTIDSQGLPVRLEFGGDGRKTLVLFLSAECPACAETLPIWKRLTASAPAERIRTIALTLQDTAPVEEKLGQAGLELPVHRALADGGAERWRLSLVPMTVLIDAGGIVSKVWMGMPADPDIEQMTEALR